MEIQEIQVINALKKVNDPDLKKDLISLNMIKDIEIAGNKVTFTLVLTTPACPLKELMRRDCEAAIRKETNQDVEVEVNFSSQVTSVRDQGPVLPNVKNIIAVASGKGGVGKSTVATNLAVALAKEGAKVGLIDADLFGPSTPTMFNCENEQPALREVNGKSMIIPIEQYGVKLLSIGFLTPPDQAVIWRGAMASSALKQFFTDADWGELDYLLIDLPPGTSDIHLTMVQTVPVTGAVIVTTPQKVALADAQKGISMFKQEQINVPVLGIVENMAYFTPEELPENKYFIFGENGGINFAEKNEVNLLGQIPIFMSVREGGDSGYPSVLKDGPAGEAFSELARNVAQQVAIRNATIDKTNVVEMQEGRACSV